jgi:hypothetical protein
VMATKAITIVGYHVKAHCETVTKLGYWTYNQEPEFTYTFENFFHPFVGELIQQLNRESLPGMLDPTFHAGLKADFFTSFYTLHVSNLVKINYFPKEIDVTDGGPWELFFHSPLTVAVHLSKNQRFAEAQRWFHHIFDPSANDTFVNIPERYWRFIAFRNVGAGKGINELLTLLSKPVFECTPDELKLKEKILSGYEAIKSNPFSPTPSPARGISPTCPAWS